MDVVAKLRKYQIEQKYCTLFRKLGKKHKFRSSGYVLGCNSNFVLMLTMDEFTFSGYQIYPIAHISRVRRNKFDKYIDKIVGWEGLKEGIVLNDVIDTTSYRTIFTTIKKAKQHVIVECESPEFETFTIGPITKVSSTAVFIRYFDSAGYLKEDLTRIPFIDISTIAFDNNYINVFSKYLRHKDRGAKE